MLGRNEIIPATKSGQQGEYAVHEMFLTLQGEGPRVGTPSVFVRLHGCILKCFFCDTDFSQNMEATTESIVQEAIVLRSEMNVSHVVITGGEPFRQWLVPLVAELVGQKFTVEIETSGVVPPAMRPQFQTLSEISGLSIVISPKTNFVLPELLSFDDVAFKYIVRAGQSSDDDGLPITSTQVQHTEERIFRPWDIDEGKFFRKCPERIFLQPMDLYLPTVGKNLGPRDVEAFNRNTQAAVEACWKFGYRLSLQTHKLIGLP